MKEQSDFAKNVISLIQSIPRGKVATYSQIAKLAGNSLGTRGVVWILHSQSNSKSLPWYRVVNAQGRISFPEMSPLQIRQKKLLEQEGILFNDQNKIDLKTNQWTP